MPQKKKVLTLEIDESDLKKKLKRIEILRFLFGLIFLCLFITCSICILFLFWIGFLLIGTIATALVIVVMIGGWIYLEKLCRKEREKIRKWQKLLK